MLSEISDLIAKMDSEMPVLVKKHTEEIGKHDKKVAELKFEINTKTLAYLKNVKSFNRDQKCKMFLEIRKLFEEAEKLADRKVELAQTLYDKVDANIKKMDEADRKTRDLRAKNTKKIEENLANIQSPAKKAPAGRKDKKKSMGTEQKTARLAENDAIMKEIQIPTISLVNDMEMPIDPNEPTYCTCHSVSFGQMVACDNKDCLTEWFHFSCVGITEEPPGKWYCEACRATMPKKRR